MALKKKESLEVYKKGKACLFISKHSVKRMEHCM